MTLHQINFPEWPDSDRTFWKQLTTKVGPLDNGGELSHLRPSTLKITAQVYGRWLAWLSVSDPEALSLAPIDRITGPRVEAWIASMGAHSANTRKMQIDNLIRVFSARDGASGLDPLRRIQIRLRTRAAIDHGDRKIGRILDAVDIIEAALKHAEDSKAEGSKMIQARMVRNAAMLAFLAMMPLRIKNFATLETGYTILIDAETVQVALPASETKNHRPYECLLGDPCAALLRLYLQESRPILQAHTRAPDNFLWLSETGRRYTVKSMGMRVTKASKVILGVSVPPHFFRDSVATTLARRGADQSSWISPILGHSDTRTAERHYNHACQIDAGRNYAAVLRGLLS